MYRWWTRRLYWVGALNYPTFLVFCPLFFFMVPLSLTPRANTKYTTHQCRTPMCAKSKQIRSPLFFRCVHTMNWAERETHTFQIQDFLYIFSKNILKFHIDFLRLVHEKESLPRHWTREWAWRNKRWKKCRKYLFILKNISREKNTYYFHNARVVGVLWWNRSEAFSVDHRNLNFCSINILDADYLEHRKFQFWC